VASKLVEAFSVPAVVICKNGEALKGSGRSLENINLKEILDGCKHIFEGYGGHPLAAGVHLKSEFLEKANDVFNQACEKYYKVNGYPKNIRYYDVSLSPKLISIKTVSMLLDTMYPYCSQFNPEPIFLLKDAIIESPSLREIGSWKILTFSASKDGEKTSIQFKTFSGGMGTEISGCKADIYFSFPQTTEKNRFNQSPTLNVIDLVIK
jgi:single-stranded-DNA-specific exonuclease